MTINFDAKSIGNAIKSHWPVIVGFAGAIWTRYGSTIAAYVQAHPKLSALYGFAAFCVAYYLRSPLTKVAPQAPVK